MSLKLTAFTRRGTELALGIREALGEGEVWTKEKLARQGVFTYSNLKAWVKEQFEGKNDLIFVSAAGIAVRSIAPFVEDKFTDPAVVCVDEGGRFAVPLLSGHVGGANALARRIAGAMGATAVVSTATDVNGCFAVDQWAAEQGMTVSNRSAAKAISSALLAGGAVAYASELPHGPLPEGVIQGESVPGFAVTCRLDENFSAGMLVLHPKLLTVGIGCKRGTGAQRMEESVNAALNEAGLARESVAEFATIDLKGDEPGLIALAEGWGVPIRLFTAQELQRVPGKFTPSEFVRSVTGVDNVCERAAVAAAEGGALLLPKLARNGVTVAVARKKWTATFPTEEEETHGL